MLRRGFLFALPVLVLIWQSAAQAGPASTAPQASAVVSETQLQDLKSYTYAFVTTQTSMNKVKDAAAALVPKIDAAIDSGLAAHRAGCLYLSRRKHGSE